MPALTQTLSKRVLLGAALAGGIPIALLLSAFATEFKPEEIEQPPVYLSAGKPSLEMGQSFSILSWNLQYCAGRNRHFFYDGGSAVHGDPEEVMETMNQIIETIKSANPDLILIQEIDRNAKRTQNIDQLREFVDQIGGVSWTSTPYHKSPFVPMPPSDPLGRVDLNLALLSKYKMQQATRIQLPLLNESRIRQIFNLKRAILDSSLPIIGHKKALKIGVTHLSAFSYGDGTLEKQIDKLDKWMNSHPPDQPWILTGDLNLLPPGDNPKRLGESAELYSDKNNPITKLIPKYKTAITSLLSEQHRTYLPYGADKADRKIDYVFYGGPLTVQEAKVLDHVKLSDHLPLSVRFRLAEAH